MMATLSSTCSEILKMRRRWRINTDNICAGAAVGKAATLDDSNAGGKRLPTWLTLSLEFALEKETGCADQRTKNEKKS
jgi:hypothetical protein